MRFVILDTNVVVSALLTKNRDSNPAILLKHVISRHITAVYSDDLINEYREVLMRPKFKLSEKEVDDVIRIFRQFGIHDAALSGLKYSPRCEDADDQPFYDLMLSTDALLITGNKKDYPDDARVFTPAEYLDAFQSKSERE